MAAVDIEGSTDALAELALTIGEPLATGQDVAVLTPILRLGSPDPQSAWQEHVQRLHARCAALGGLGVGAFSLHGAGIDLVVGPIGGSV